MERIIFYLLAAIIVIFSIKTVTSRIILRAAIYLLFVLLATAGLYFMLNYNFLGAVQLTVYSGGVVVLIVFAVLLTSHINQRLTRPARAKSFFAALLSISGMIVTLTAIYKYPFPEAGIREETAFDVSAIGKALVSYDYGGYVLPFEVISVLLLAAMIGAIMIAKREKS